MPQIGDDDDEEDLVTVEELDDGPDDEDEGDEGPGSEGGQEVGEEETEDGTEDQGQEQRRPGGINDELPPARQRRSQSRWQQREQELAATRRRAEEAEARAAQLASERQREEAQRLHAQAQERDRRREMMTPEERTADELQELRAQINYQAQMDRFHRTDAEDRATFQAKASVNKVYKRHQTRVEEELRKARASGTNLSREQILRYIIGDEAIKMSEQTSKPQATARRRVVSKPVNSRGDSTSTPGKRSPSSDKEALRKRLENIPL